MNTVAVDRIAKAVLYEGYMLYPYRPSALKNQQRFNFGVVYPQSYVEVQTGSDRATVQTECLVLGSGQTAIEVHLRFLQLAARSVQKRVAAGNNTDRSDPGFALVESLEVDGQKFCPWEEAVEREVRLEPTKLEDLVNHPLQHPIRLPFNASHEILRDQHRNVAGRLTRTRHFIEAEICVFAHSVDDHVHKITVRVSNAAPLEELQRKRRTDALMRSLVSAHVVLGAHDGVFVSLLDPPAALREIASQCRNDGLFPVLAGELGQHDTMLASPIILYDYPRIAPESAGDLFDGTEIDEILSLRVMTMTEDEKREMRHVDDRTRQLLESIESLPAEHLMKLHGVLRGLRPLQEDANE